MVGEIVLTRYNNKTHWILLSERREKKRKGSRHFDGDWLEVFGLRQEYQRGSIVTLTLKNFQCFYTCLHDFYRLSICSRLRSGSFMPGINIAQFPEWVKVEYPCVVDCRHIGDSLFLNNFSEYVGSRCRYWVLFFCVVP